MDAELVSKAEFARRIKRSPGRVSQLLSEGKITAEADGRIELNKALSQLRLTLDVSQQLAQPDPILPGTEAGKAPTNDAARTARAKAESAEVKAIEDRSRLLEARRRWIRTEDAAREWQRGMGELLQLVEARFAEIGKQLAAELKAEPRMVTTLLMREWRQARAVIERSSIERRDQTSDTVSAPELSEGEGPQA